MDKPMGEQLADALRFVESELEVDGGTPMVIIARLPGGKVFLSKGQGHFSDPVGRRFVSTYDTGRKNILQAGEITTEVDIRFVVTHSKALDQGG